jgi:hypothetical protein
MRYERDQLETEFKMMKNEFSELKKNHEILNRQIECLFNLYIIIKKQTGQKTEITIPKSNKQIAVQLLNAQGSATKVDFIRAGIKFSHPEQWSRFMRYLGTLPGYTCEKINPLSRNSPLQVVYKEMLP